MSVTAESMKYVQTTCPHCGVGCTLNLVVSNDKVVGVESNRRSPINEGKLCPNGMNSWKPVHSPDRLTSPLIKKDGKFVEASWDEALDLVASKLKEASDKHGPQGLAFQVSCRTPNEDCYIMQKFARVGFKTNNVDNCARINHSPSVEGLSLSFGTGAATNPFEDVLNSDLVFMIGSNAVETHPLASRRIVQAKKKGASIIVCDPRYTQTARLADTYIRYNPSTHIALLNSMMYWIIKDGMYDKDFVEKRTKGFEELKATVEKYEDVSDTTGVSPDTVREIAQKYAEAKNAVIIYSLGITELTTGTDNVRSLANLAMLCGNIGKPGVGVNPLRGKNNAQGACDMGAYPNVYSGYQACEADDSRKKMEEAWGVTGLPSEYGVTLTEQIDQCGDKIKAMYILGVNPVVAYPDSNHVKQSLEKLDFLVVQDIFLTETCELADVVLPGASFAEKDGTFTNGERRINRIRQAVQPPGDAKVDYFIFVELAKKMGLKGFDFASAQDVWDDMRACTPSMFGCTYEKIEKPESVYWPCPTVEASGTPILHVDKFSTPDGLGTFVGVEYRAPAEVADAEYPFTLMTGHSNVIHHEVSDFVQINTEDAQRLGIKTGHPIKLASRRGETITTARVTDEVDLGVLMMTTNFDDGVNKLTNTARDPVSKTPELKHCAVKVEILGGN